jgi:DNA polymerase-3 subunit gamma/tau
VTDVRRLWPEVLEEVKGKRRFTWILLSQNAQVADVRDGTLTLAMANTGARDSFGRGGSEDILREALIVVLGADFHIQTMVDVSAQPQQARQTVARPSEPASADEMIDDRDAAATLGDQDLDEPAASETDLLERHLGAEIIAEEEHGA